MNIVNNEPHPEGVISECISSGTSLAFKKPANQEGQTDFHNMPNDIVTFCSNPNGELSTNIGTSQNTLYKSEPYIDINIGPNLVQDTFEIVEQKQNGRFRMIGKTNEYFFGLCPEEDA